MRVNFKVRAFFDDPKVIAITTEKERKPLSKAGAFVRRRQMSIIRRRKRASNPGEPPSAHGDDLKKRIEFDYDSASRGVVVGAIKLNKVQFAASLFSQTTVPHTLEFGGQGTRVEERLAGPLRETNWIGSDYRRKETKHAISMFRKTGQRQITLNLSERGGPPVFVAYRIVKATIEARPSVGPALEHERPKFPGLFANSLT